MDNTEKLNVVYNKYASYIVNIDGAKLKLMSRTNFINALNELNETHVKRSKFIEFLDSIRDYEKESHNMIGFDERESSEFVDIYLNKNSLNAAKRIES